MFSSNTTGCAPSNAYFVLAMIALGLNIYDVLKYNKFSTTVSVTILVVHSILAILWKNLITYMCTIKMEYIGWVLVYLPFIIYVFTGVFYGFSVVGVLSDWILKSREITLAPTLRPTTYVANITMSPTTMPITTRT